MVLNILLGLCLLPVLVYGHGRMVEPPARNTMWRMDFNTPENYDDTELFCGGLKVSILNVLLHNSFFVYE